MGIDWTSFALGLSLGVVTEALVGAFITAPLAVWWLRRKKSELVNDLLEDKELMGRLRNGLVNGMLGNMGGRPMSVKQMLRASAGMTLQVAGPAIAKSVLGRVKSIQNHQAQRARAAKLRTQSVETTASPVAEPSADSSDLSASAP